MNPLSTLPSGLSTIGLVVILMAVIAAVEVAIPLQAPGPRRREHLGPNLALTGIGLVVNLLLNGGLVVMLAWAASLGIGLLPWFGVSGALAGVLAIAALDLSVYLSHVTMHKVPLLWRVHRVHHLDRFVDVTTTIRQHPAESAIRYLFLTVCALALGVGPVAFAAYRAASVIIGLLEHANIHLPPRLDRALALVTTSPDLHKVHHSRSVHQTDSNYGNVFSLWDRWFRTFTPPPRGTAIEYGLDESGRPAPQTTFGLLRVPFTGHPRP